MFAWIITTIAPWPLAIFPPAHFRDLVPDPFSPGRKIN
jgi:hypothetical protein